MLIYEKENKLNINFDNEVSEQPDLQISKENGQVNIEAGGQPIGGGSEIFVVTFSGTTTDGNAACDKTWEEISDAYDSGTKFDVYWSDGYIKYSLVPWFDSGDEGLYQLSGNLSIIQNDSIGQLSTFCLMQE